MIYQWDNLFYCCDQCQSDANSTKPFEVTIKPDAMEYEFEKIFYFDPQLGEIKVLENLKKLDFNLFEKAEKFLNRYGINKHPERCQARKNMYIDAINLLKLDKLGNLNDRPFRAVVKTAKKVIDLKATIFKK